MKDFDGILIFLAVVVVVIMLFLGVRSAVQQSFKASRTSPPQGPHQQDSVSKNLQSLQDQQRRQRDQQERKTNDMQRQAQFQQDLQQRRLQDMQRRHQR